MSLRVVFIVTFSAGALASAACGNVYADPIEVSGVFGGSTASSTGSIPVTKTPPTACPDSINENGPCNDEGAVCESGQSSDPDCNAKYTCTRDRKYGLSWVESKAPNCAGRCPDSAQIVNGAPCTLAPRADSGIAEETLELQCAGQDTLCACTTGPDGAHVHERRWVCVAAGTGCPVSRPNVGRRCLGDRVCDYGSCEFKRGTGMKCEDDVWQVEAQTCR